MKNYIKPDLLLLFLLLLLIPLLFPSYFSFLSCQTVALIHLVCQSLRFVLSSWLRTASAKVYKVENSPRAPVSSSFTASSSAAVATAAAVLLGKFRIMRKLTSQDFSIVYWRKNCAIINFLCYFAAFFCRYRRRLNILPPPACFLCPSVSWQSRPWASLPDAVDTSSSPLLGRVFLLCCLYSAAAFGSKIF